MNDSLNASYIEVTNNFKINGNVYIYGNTYAQQTTVTGNVVNQTMTTKILTTNNIHIENGVIENSIIETTTNKLFTLANTTVGVNDPAVMSIDPGVIEVTENVSFACVELAVPLVELNDNFTNASTLTIDGPPAIVSGSGTITNSYALLVEDGTIATTAEIPSTSSTTGAIVTAGGIGIGENIFLENAGIHFGGDTSTMFVGIINEVPQINYYNADIHLTGDTTFTGSLTANVVSDTAPAIVFENFTKNTAGEDTAVIELNEVTSNKPAIWREATVPFGKWRAVAYNGTVFCAVGKGQCATSADGMTWTARTIPVYDWNAIVWSPASGLFVAVGNTSYVATSANGISWSSIDTGFAQDWTAVVVGGTTLCAVSQTAGAGIKTMTSTNGTSWALGSTSFGAPVYSIAWGASKFVATGDGIVAYSSTGVSWTIAVDATFDGSGAVGYGTMFVYLSDAGLRATSPDGVVWTVQDPSVLLNTPAWTGMTYIDGTYYVCDANGYNGIGYTTDGEAYGYQTLGVPINEIATSSAVAVCVGSGGNAYYSLNIQQRANMISSTGLSSNDGTLIRNDLTISGDTSIGNSLMPWETVVSDDTKNFNAVIYANGEFCCIENTGKKFYTSVDGKIWKQSSSYSGDLRTMAYGGGIAVALGATLAYSSPDYINWTQNTAPAITIKSVAYSGTIFCAVGSPSTEAGYSITSADGINWDVGTLPSDSWTNVRYVNGIFIATAYESIATSADGINWDIFSGGVFDLLLFSGSAYFNSVYYLYTQSGSVLYSNDAITWLVLNTVSPLIYDIINLGDSIVGYGRATTSSVYNIYITTDNTNWYTQKSQLPEIAQSDSFAYSASLNIVVGSFVTKIVRSAPIYSVGELSLGSYGLADINLKGASLSLQGCNATSGRVYPIFTSNVTLSNNKFWNNAVFGLYELNFEIEYIATGVTLVITTPVSVINLSNGNTVPCVVSAKNTETPWATATYTATNEITVVISGTSPVLSNVYGMIVFEYTE